MFKKAVITGGAGFIGSSLAKRLLDENVNVTVVDNFAGGKINSRLFPEIAYHEFDICDYDSLTQVFKGKDVVFHMAALPRVQDTINHPIETARANIDGTLAVLEAARHSGVGKVVFSSSAAVYGGQSTMPLRESMEVTPKSPYGLHKYMGERMCSLWSDLYSLPTVSLRYFNVYGPGFDPSGAYALVVGRFIDLRSQNKPLTIAGDGTNTRDYVNVMDVVRANLLAADNNEVKKGEVINIGSGVEISVKDLADMIGGPQEYVEPRVEPTRSVSDISRAQEVLGWEPRVPLAEGIAELKSIYGIL